MPSSANAPALATISQHGGVRLPESLIARRAERKLEALHAAARLDDLRVPASNRLE